MSIGFRWRDLDHRRHHRKRNAGILWRLSIYYEEKTGRLVQVAYRRGQAEIV